MGGGITRQLWASFAALRSSFANPNLRRLQLAGAASLFGIWGYNVALAVFAYRAGGARDIAIVSALRVVPPALAGPFAGVVADRWPRRRVMFLSDLARTAVLAAAAAALVLEASPFVVYSLVAAGALAATPFAPAAQALRPALARTPEELTAANVASSTIASVALLAAPALGGVLLAATSDAAVFAFAAGTLAWSAVLVRRLEVDAQADAPRPGAWRSRDELLAGVRTIGRDAGLRTVAALYASQTLVGGVLNVLIVFVALDLLGFGGSGVGYLYATIGLGSLAGSLVSVALVARNRLAADFAVGMIVFGAPIALVGVLAEPAAAVALLAVAGVANSVIGIAGQTLLQRIVPPDVMARVFGVIGSLVTAVAGLGAVLGPLLASAVGTRGALIGSGAVSPLLALLFWRRLRRLDAATEPAGRGFALLRAAEMFAVLPPLVVEALAAELARVRMPRGSPVFRQGDAGDRFYVIDAGEADVCVDGRIAGRLGPGDSFGEIALLRDVPRTATVTARTDLALYALPREPFLEAVSADTRSSELAASIVADRVRGIALPSRLAGGRRQTF